MNRPYYSEYVKHALRFYTRNLSPVPTFKTEADKNNWYSCLITLKGCSDLQRNIIIDVYSGYDTLADNVYEASKKYDVNQSVIWDLMKVVERKVAKRRGLM